MLGLFFAHISPANGDTSHMLIKTGVVKAQVGAERWLLEFNAKGYNFSNVFRAEQLESFAFFNTLATRDQFIAELIAANTAPPRPPPRWTR